MVLAAIGIWALRRAYPELGVFIPGRRIVYWGLLAAGLLLGIAAAIPFRRARTSFNPVRPSDASALVTSGVFRLTRNPMYVGMAGLLVANAVRRGSWLALLPVGGFVVAVDRLQVQNEERALSSNFGKDYEDYRASVPRWLGLPKST